MIYRFVTALPFLLLGSVLQAQTPSEQPIRLETSTGVVTGTLLLPGARSPAPVALLIAGSGPTNRDGNTIVLPGANNSLKLLAEGLARQGIASVRYDKRGVGESAAAAPGEGDLRFGTYVDDAAAWIRQLRQDRRFSTVAVVGHSEGSLIGMLATRQAGAHAFISVAGIARPASLILRDQLRPQLPPGLWKESERILASLEAGRTADSVPPMLFALYRPSIQPYLISWIRYNPAQEITKLSVPVLIVQGTTDIQVTTGEAQALKQARPSAELLIVEGVNHVLKAVEADRSKQMASYTDPALPIAPELVERVSTFIRAVKPGRA